MATITTAAVWGCSGTSGSGGDHGPVLGGPGRNGSGTGGGAAPTTGPAATPGSTLWVQIFGGPGSEQIVGLATDAGGNFYVAGSQSEPTPDPETGSNDNLFILKYSPTGELLWRQPIPFTFTNELQMMGIAIQPTTGAVIITGSFNGTVNIGATAMTSGTHPPTNGGTLSFPAINVFLAAYDAAGYFLWSRGYSSNESVFPTQVFTAANGDIELAGEGDNNATVGGGPLCCREGQFNGPISFVARYGPKGDPIWSNVIGGDFASDGAGADADGGMVVGGAAQGTVTYQGETVAAGASSANGPNAEAGVVLRIDGQGQKLWLKTYQPTEFTRIGATLDPARNVVLFGNFGGETGGTLDLGNGVTVTDTSRPPAILGSGLVAKLDPSGTARWAKAFAGNDSNVVFPDGISIDSAGNIGLVGEIDGGLNVGGATLLPAGLPPGTHGEFVAKYAPDGSHLWSRAFAIEHGAGSFSKRAVAFTPDGALGFGGGFHNTVDFGTGPITVPGEHREVRGSAPLPPDDMFLLKLAP